jgi:uncharacterized protein YbaR (Trm112 family)
MSEKKEIISEQLLKILACPICKNDVKLIEYKLDVNGLKCNECNKIYPIKNGIPIMIIEEAIDLSKL